jgi:oxaloacetate decarboxylase gamma subunit
MEANLVIEGLKFMVLGMGTVFIFLIVLILLMKLQARIIEKYFPEPHGAPDTLSAAPSAPAKDNKKIAAIAAAIMHHNKV